MMGDSNTHQLRSRPFRLSPKIGGRTGQPFVRHHCSLPPGPPPPSSSPSPDLLVTIDQLSPVRTPLLFFECFLAAAFRGQFQPIVHPIADVVSANVAVINCTGWSLCRTWLFTNIRYRYQRSPLFGLNSVRLYHYCWHHDHPGSFIVTGSVDHDTWPVLSRCC